jgi:hypothetical protein
LIPEGESAYGAEALKALGTQGSKEFQERAQRIQTLNERLGNVPTNAARTTGGVVDKSGEMLSVLQQILAQFR